MAHFFSLDLFCICVVDLCCFFPPMCASLLSWQERKKFTLCQNLMTMWKLSPHCAANVRPFPPGSLWIMKYMKVWDITKRAAQARLSGCQENKMWAESLVQEKQEWKTIDQKKVLRNLKSMSVKSFPFRCITFQSQTFTVCEFICFFNYPKLPKLKENSHIQYMSSILYNNINQNRHNETTRNVTCSCSKNKTLWKHRNGRQGVSFTFEQQMLFRYPSVCLCDEASSETQWQVKPSQPRL